MTSDSGAIDLVERFNTVLAIDGAAPAVEFDGKWYSYGEMRAMMQSLQAILSAQGAVQGFAVGMLLRNRPAHLAAELAVIMSGYRAVTINPMLPSAPLREDLEQLRLPVLIADEQDWQSSTVSEAAQKTGSVGISISTRDGKLAVSIVNGLERRTQSDYRETMPGVAIEMLSSGTTGKPKRINLALRALSQSLYTAAKAESRDVRKVELRSSVQLQWLPLVHVAGIWNGMYALYNGRRLALLEKFDVDKWHALLVRHRPRFANFPPSALRMILERNFPKEDFSSLIAIRTGTAPLDHQLATAFEERYGIPVLEAYGATEFAGGVAGWSLEDYRKYGKDKRRSVGRANAGVELRVVDRETFEILPTGQQGLLEVRTKQIEDGLRWVRTTDLASLDGEGFLYIHGRADNAIIRGGFKIMPDHVESVLRAHPAVYEVSVVGLRDERLGQVPVAALQLQPGAPQPSNEELQQFLRTRLKPYEIPTAFAVVTEMPRTPSMKISQPAIAALFQTRVAS